MGRRAAEELLEALEAGGAVDKYIQVLVVGLEMLLLLLLVVLLVLLVVELVVLMVLV